MGGGRRTRLFEDIHRPGHRRSAASKDHPFCIPLGSFSLKNMIPDLLVCLELT